MEYQWIPFATRHPDPEREPYIWVFVSLPNDPDKRGLCMDGYWEIARVNIDRYASNGYYLTCFCGNNTFDDDSVPRYVPLLWYRVEMPNKPLHKVEEE